MTRPVAPHRTRPTRSAGDPVSPLCSLPPAAFQRLFLPASRRARQLPSPGRSRASGRGAVLRRGGLWESCPGACALGPQGRATPATQRPRLPHRASAALTPGSPARPSASAGAQGGAVGFVYPSPPFQLFPRRDLKSPGTNWGAGSSAEWGALIAARPDW